MSQAVFDSLPEALAVFSPAGILVMSNAAYAQLWGMDPSTQLGQVGISDALRHWQATTAPTQVWVKAHDYVCAMADRLEWRGEVSLLDGRRLACRLAPVQGGSTLIGFTEISPASAQTVPRRKIALRRVGSGRGTADLGEQSGILAESA